MNIGVICYSRTGTTSLAAGQAASRLKRAGHNVSEIKIEPKVLLPYAAWLLFSFIPRSFVPIKPLDIQSLKLDSCLLALPKWTFSCPPVNAFLRKNLFNLPPCAVLTTYGGWNERPYLNALMRRLSKKHKVLGGIALKKSEIHQNLHTEKLNHFLDSIFGGSI